MTASEYNIICALGNGVTFLPGGWDKRFVYNLINKKSGNWEEATLTDSQKEWIYRLVYKYRRQIPDTYEQFKNHQHCSRKPAREIKRADLSIKPIEQRSECEISQLKLQIG